MLQESITRATAWRIYRARLPLILLALGLGLIYVIVYNILRGTSWDILLITLSFTIPLIGIASYMGARIGISRQADTIFTLTADELRWEKMDRKVVIPLSAVTKIKKRRSGLWVKSTNKKTFIPRQLEQYEAFKSQLAPINDSSS